MRLRTGRVLIHSRGSFSPKTVAAIPALGGPVALVKGTLIHNTFATAGRQAFPEVPCFYPILRVAKFSEFFVVRGFIPRFSRSPDLPG